MVHLFTIDFFTKFPSSTSRRGDYSALPTDKYLDDELNPTISSNSSWHLSRALNQRRTLIAGFITFLSTTIALTIILLRSPPYSPLDHYQNLNTLPLVPSSPVLSSATPPPEACAIVSTMYSDSYAIALAVLGHSIQSSNTTGRLVLPYLPNRISQQGLCIVRSAGWEPLPIPYIPAPNSGEGTTGRFIDQYTKLNIWSLDKQGFQRVVYLDGDTLVRKSFDELWKLPFDFAAVPDVYGDKQGFTLNFNAGVLAIRPSSTTLDVILDKIKDAKYPRQEAEQAYLNQFYSSSAVRLPYAYNANLAIKTRSKALWDGLKKEMRIVHFTLNKPFLSQDPNVVSSVIPTPEEQRAIVEHAKTRNRGLFEEEVGWWGDAFEAMMRSEVGQKMKACYELEAVGVPQMQVKGYRNSES
ncbi:nucleotide-diphospho-sugar transferase [Pluteus cervinus]|uniref:Nucleotide-diphospho-sugar transferase n=1 Tax=Pluteus cervinus TaxID=181527 RepID=A0ACD3ARG3_9AGAR|nr:nucleotide-diphospho-sugar transferase [Pluteus cervinus]